MKGNDAKFVGVLSALAAAAALALVASQVFTQVGLRRAMDAADHREAEEFLSALREAVGPNPPTNALLEDFLAEHYDEGLRYVALARHGEVRFSAGASHLSPAQRGLRRGEGLVRAQWAPPGPRGRRGPPGLKRPGKRPGKRPPHPPGLDPESPHVIEFVPVLGPELQRDARLGLGASVFAIVLFGLFALLLRQMIHQRRAALSEAEDARRLAVLGEMTAVLAHEIRNPLASLKGHAQLLVEMLEGSERAKADKVVSEAWRLEELTRHLLDFVRNADLDLASTDLAALARDVAGSTEGEFVVRGEASAKVDAARLRQALTNLASNGVAAGGPVELVLSIRGGTAVIDVLDSGPGIEGDLESLCEPFFTTRTRGTGLGLSIAKRIVEQHGGTLHAGNRPEGGARFSVELPLEAS